MRRYRFRLEAVLRLRRAEEERAKEALQAANISLRSLLLTRDAEALRLAGLRSGPGTTTVEDLRRERQAAELCAASLAGAQRAVTAAAASAALAQVGWSTASRRVAVLERLDARRRAEHDEDVLRSEVAATDDLVTARYVAESARRRSGSTSAGAS